MEDNNEIEVNIIDVTGVNESTVMSRLEIHSTPNVVLDSKLDESNVIDDSGIQLTPIATNKNNQPDSNDMMQMMHLFFSNRIKCQMIIIRNLMH